jgi:molybdopterin biosynthesis enzyme
MVYAVKAKDTQGAKETAPALLNLKGKVRIGEKTHEPCSKGTLSMWQQAQWYLKAVTPS